MMALITSNCGQIRWNVLDSMLVILISIIGSNRLPYIFNPATLEADNAFYNYDGLTWHGDLTHWFIAVLCIIAYTRLM